MPRLRLEARAPRIDRAPSPALDAARATWLRRMAHEHQSSAVFSRLHPQLIEAEAPLDTKLAVLRCAMDELEHAELAATVVVMLGGEPELEMPLATEPLPEHPSCTPRERALRNVLFASCLSETVSVALLAAERESVEVPEIAAVIDRLFRDEVRHARLGWDHLGSIWAALDDAERRRTERYVPAALRHLERCMLEQMPVAAAPDAAGEAELRALGVLPGAGARELLYATLNEVLVPRLAAFGVHAG